MKPWGYEEILYEDESWRVKKITVMEGHQTSLQFHREKFEAWCYEDGRILFLPQKTIHRLTGPVTVIEFARGSDEDVVRLKDDYNRL